MAAATKNRMPHHRLQAWPESGPHAYAPESCLAGFVSPCGSDLTWWTDKPNGEGMGTKWSHCQTLLLELYFGILYSARKKWGDSTMPRTLLWVDNGLEFSPEPIWDATERNSARRASVRGKQQCKAQYLPALISEWLVFTKSSYSVQ